MEAKEKAYHGKQASKKLNPYLVLQYLLRETDEDHQINYL